MKFIILVMIVVLSTFAQTAYNSKVHNLAISGFASDTLRYTDKFAAGDYEGVDVVVMSTSQDSAKFLVGYQRGYPVWGSTVWENPTVVFDTFDVAIAANYRTQDSLFYAASGDTDLVALVDSTQLSGYTIMVRHLYPFRSPFARIVVKGLTGNSDEAYDLFFAVSQPKYVRVDVGPGKQPQ